MTDSQPTGTIFDRVVAAAAAGDKAACAALAALEQAAAQAGVTALSGAERGRAEALRRFGPIPGDSA